MRKLLLLLLLVSTARIASAQSPDSLRQIIVAGKSDTTTCNALAAFSTSFYYSHPDSALLFASEGLSMSKSLRYRTGEIRNTQQLGLAYMNAGDFPRALECLLKGLQMNEADGDSIKIQKSKLYLSLLYNNEKEYEKGVRYALSALSGAKDEALILALQDAVGEAFQHLGKLDSALFYTNNNYSLAVKRKQPGSIAFEKINLAEIYMEMGNDKLALTYYRDAWPQMINDGVDEAICDESYHMADIFEHMHDRDSALWYARKSFFTAKQDLLILREEVATEQLASVYENAHQTDSALSYLKLSIVLKDSIFNAEKLKQVQALSFRETTRQQEIIEQRKKDSENATRNLQLMAIAIFIPIFFLLLLFLGRIRVKPRLVEFLAVVDLLLCFEFLTDLIYPFMSTITHERPIWDMLILVSIAALLEPAAFRLERWMKRHVAHSPSPVRTDIGPSD